MLRGVNLNQADSDSDSDSLDNGNGNDNSKPVTSTRLQSYSKMTMELQDDIANQELQVGALTNFVINMHDTIAEVFTKMITNVLVEEDWNHNGWLGTMLA